MDLTKEYFVDNGYQLIDITKGGFKVIIKKEVFLRHVDEYDEDVYETTLFCFTHHIWLDNVFTDAIHISKIEPGVYTEGIDFTHSSGKNKHLTVEEVDAIINALHLDISIHGNK